MDEQALPLKSAGWLYLVSMVLVVVGGATMQSYSAVWGLLGTEVLCILLPTLVFLRLSKLPLKKSLRINNPELPLIFLSLVVGGGVWFFAAFLDVTLTQVTGFILPLPPDWYPTSAAQVALLFAALAVAPAICEEVLFRGALQTTFARRFGIKGVVAASMLFAVFHMRLISLPALIPISVVLGYVMWRTRSLTTAVLVHFANNTMAVVLISMAALNPQVSLPFPSLTSGLMGLAVAIAGLVLFDRAAKKQPDEVIAVVNESVRTRLAWRLPLVLAGLIFIGVAGLDTMVGISPQILATGRQMELGSPPWQAESHYRYELRNKADEAVGEALCRVVPAAEQIDLNCEMRVQAFDTSVGEDHYLSDSFTTIYHASWQTESMRLISMEGVLTAGEERQSWTVKPEADGLLLETSHFDGSLASAKLPVEALLQGEWQFRLMALPLELAYASEVTYALPNPYQPHRRASAPLKVEKVVYVSGGQPIHTPAGNFITWRAMLLDQEETAYYDIEAPHTLVQFDDGLLVWSLLE